MGMAQVALRQYDEGITTLEHAVEATRRGAFPLGMLGWALALAGESAFRLLARAEEQYQSFILFPGLPGFELLRTDPGHGPPRRA
jgi:hypothetical protein